MNRFVLKDPLSKRSKKIEGFIDSNGCYICDSHSPMKDGRYYQIKRNKTMIMLHRYTYSNYNGEIPDGLIVRHKCDNDLCVNPNHLELGTHQDNANDKGSRGRSLKGENSSNSILTDGQVDEIRNLLGKLPQREIA